MNNNLSNLLTEFGLEESNFGLSSHTEMNNNLQLTNFDTSDTSYGLSAPKPASLHTNNMNNIDPEFDPNFNNILLPNTEVTNGLSAPKRKIELKIVREEKPNLSLTTEFKLPEVKLGLDVEESTKPKPVDIYASHIQPRKKEVREKAEDIKKTKINESRLFKIIKKPRDGNSLFHCLALGINRKNHIKIRYQVANWIKVNSEMEINGAPLSDWIYWEMKYDVGVYCNALLSGSWAGALEILAFTLIKEVDVIVYDIENKQLKKIAEFKVENPKTVIKLLYADMHYDFLHLY